MKSVSLYEFGASEQRLDPTHGLSWHSYSCDLILAFQKLVEGQLHQG